ncbi:hypothetical protein FGG08_006356 [Glutinoglossum americanum]|uniref:Uncharacterized protein n=1 Tax=Glutinoglossum americanum TaxID=1670608 RepID=A0A9P8HWG3_9PEZI|nr:hypothetical protein FGG08_006356 [Glutinoglossum americanum]
MAEVLYDAVTTSRNGDSVQVKHATHPQDRGHQWLNTDMSMYPSSAQGENTAHPQDLGRQDSQETGDDKPTYKEDLYRYGWFQGLILLLVVLFIDLAIGLLILLSRYDVALDLNQVAGDLALWTFLVAPSSILLYTLLSISAHKYRTKVTRFLGTRSVFLTALRWLILAGLVASTTYLLFGTSSGLRFQG